MINRYGCWLRDATTENSWGISCDVVSYHTYFAVLHTDTDDSLSSKTGRMRNIRIAQMSEKGRCYMRAAATDGCLARAD